MVRKIFLFKATRFLSLFANLACIIIALVFTPTVLAQQKQASPIQHELVQTAGGVELRVKPIRTESPRQTLKTFLRLKDELEAVVLVYQKRKSWSLDRQITLLLDQFIELIDLSEVASISRREIGFVTTANLLDIFGRVDLPKVVDAPDVDEVEGQNAIIRWNVPGTPISITRIAEGARQGEFLFSSLSIIAAPRYFKGIEQLPLRSRLDIQSWSREVPQITGYLIPAALLSAIPKILLNFWFDTPIWKILLTAAMFALAIIITNSVHKFVRHRELASQFRNSLLAFMPPLVTLSIIALLVPFISNQIYLSGRFSAFIGVIFVGLAYLSLAWLVWLVIVAFFEWIISSPKITERSIDANLFRLTAKVAGIVAVVLVLAYGGQQIGLPIFSLMAGLGIGGVAVALAIRPTLENLIGGVILYIDKPVRVGDFCSFGDFTGTVEMIGMRSTEIRALDRTLISIPNAKFADMEIVNWARCDRMLIEEVVGLRYETTPDQLRYVLAKMREMFHAHPRIDKETVRVRFSGYGASSLNISIRVYALTREWNDFYAIKEDVLMRVTDIVSESGSGFAFPSQTLYMGQDEGLDQKRSEAADKQVKSWRRRGSLPFPNLSSQRIEELENTLDYPPKGSVELSGDTTLPIEAEGLSAEPLAEEPLSSDIPLDEDANNKDKS
jgi:MscS family membrane protein